MLNHENEHKKALKTGKFPASNQKIRTCLTCEQIRIPMHLIHVWVLSIGVEYGGAEGLEPPKRFYKGGSAPAEILLNLIAVTILANPKTLDVAKKRQHSYIVCLFHS